MSGQKGPFEQQLELVDHHKKGTRIKLRGNVGAASKYGLSFKCVWIVKEWTDSSLDGRNPVANAVHKQESLDRPFSGEQTRSSKWTGRNPYGSAPEPTGLVRIDALMCLGEKSRVRQWPGG